MVDRCHWTAIALFAITVILVLAITAVVVVARPHHEGGANGRGAHHHRHGHGGGGLRNSGPSRGVTRGTEEDPFQVHMTRVRSFLCREARPRSISVSELVSEIDDEDSWKPAVGEVVFPPVTVLHRCENTSGCCFEGGTFSCSPLDTERVRLVFMVSVVVSSGSNRGRENDPSDQGQLTDTREETIYAVNHTRCACMAAEPPK